MQIYFSIGVVSDKGFIFVEELLCRLLFLNLLSFNSINVLYSPVSKQYLIAVFATTAMPNKTITKLLLSGLYYDYDYVIKITFFRSKRSFLDSIVNKQFRDVCCLK